VCGKRRLVTVLWVEMLFSVLSHIRLFSLFGELKSNNVCFIILRGTCYCWWHHSYYNRILFGETGDWFQVSFFKKAIEDMACSSLRCVSIAYRTYDMDKVPADEQQLAQWVIPQDDLVLLAIIGIKVHVAVWLRLSFIPLVYDDILIYHTKKLFY